MRAPHNALIKQVFAHRKRFGSSGVRWGATFFDLNSEPSFPIRNLRADVFWPQEDRKIYAVHETGIQLESYRLTGEVSVESGPMPSNTLSQEELVEFARMLYGDNWREELSNHLNISRKNLVLTLASGDPVPDRILTPFLSLVEEHLLKQEELSQKLKRRVAEIRDETAHVKQSRVVRRTAS